MKIYTKIGDGGKTSLIGGTRVLKSDSRLEAYGSIDELNAFIGYLVSLLDDSQQKKLLLQVQHKLFIVGSYLATDQSKTKLKASSILKKEDVLQLEEAIDEIELELPKLKKFVLPGGSHSAASSHICRTISRRAEREIIKLCEEGVEIKGEILSYMNRLSDYFFVLSRYLNVNQGVKEIVWES